MDEWMQYVFLCSLNSRGIWLFLLLLLLSIGTYSLAKTKKTNKYLQKSLHTNAGVIIIASVSLSALSSPESFHATFLNIKKYCNSLHQSYLSYDNLSLIVFNQQTTVHWVRGISLSSWDLETAFPLWITI